MSKQRRLLGAAAFLLALIGAGACGRGLDRDLEERKGWAPPVGGPSLPDDVAQLRAQAVAFDASAEVGTLPGRSGVTPSGQAVY